MNFDQRASTWDTDPKKIARTIATAAELIRVLDKFDPLGKITNALEVGAGTGLLSFAVSSRFNNIILSDTSSGMLEIAEQKIKDSNSTNISTKLLDSASFDYTAQFNSNHFDIIYSMLTVHHILDLNGFFKGLSELQQADALFIIIDLISEDGTFHSKMPNFEGHLGFDRDKLRSIAQANQYEEICYRVFYELEKDSKAYPIFLQVFRKL